jgi:glutamyl-tRNA reductase
MALLAFGINHRTAPVDVRERVAFARERLHAALADLCRATPVREAAILSTCNRMELYCEAESDSLGPVFQWLGEYHRVPVDRIRSAAYEFWGEQAVRHVMRVASGLDSMVLGEPQILGQLKEAYGLAREADTVGPHLGRLFQQTFSVAKQVRTETGIGANPVSVAFAAVSLIRHIFSDVAHTRALLVGAGETMELVARHLREQGVGRIVVANRTLGRAQALAETVDGQAIELSDIPEALAQADIVISSTASPLPIIGKGMVEQALRRRRHAPMLMVDIAVPRDIEQGVADLQDVYLYTVDDLQQVVDENRRAREVEAIKAEEIIQRRAGEFMDQLRGLDANGVIRDYRGHVDRLRETELQRALSALQAGGDPAEVLARMSQTLTNKIMHAPSAALKRAAEEGRLDLLDWSRHLFGVADDPDDPRT